MVTVIWDGKSVTVESEAVTVMVLALTIMVELDRKLC